MKQHQDIDIIPFLISCLHKEKQLRLIAFSIVPSIGIGLLYYFGNQYTGLTIVSMMLIVTGLKFLVDTIRTVESKYHPLIKTLSFHPEEIVWVYLLKIDNMPFGIQLVSHGRLIVKLLDKTEFSLSIPNQNIDSVRKILKENLTHATFGYSDEKLQFFKIDPYLLLNNN